jgi:hypothetical protein
MIASYQTLKRRTPGHTPSFAGSSLPTCMASSTTLSLTGCLVCGMWS